MKTILKRVGRLEERHAINSSGELRVAVRLIISTPWKGPLNLAASRCRRLLNTGGAVNEIIELDGRAEDIDEEGLEKFIASFPIQSRA
jgi:hypothetical protein